MSKESQIESESIFNRIIDLIGSSLISCSECMAEFLCRGWEFTCDVCGTIFDWTTDNLCCCCCPKDNEIVPEQRARKVHRRIQESPRKRVPPNYHQQINSAHTPQVQQPKAYPQTTESQTPSIQQNAPLTVRSPIHTPLSNGTKTITDHQEVGGVEPPKIEFVETGSIFGDRKRVGFDQSLFQLENGRFRSPGQPKTISGPGGRMIRVSFVTGFPVVKSVESTRSTVSKVLSKKSVESGASEGLHSRKLMAIKSYKSIKSINSIDSKDGEPLNSKTNSINK